MEQRGAAVTPAAVFRKILSAAKSKRKSGNIQYETEEASGTSAIDVECQEFERRKHEWQEELETMSEFLVIKSAQEQREEGVEQPVDTAYIGDRDGMPVLRAVFDVHHFHTDDIELCVENDELTLEAVNTEVREDKLYRKKIIRKLNLPEFVDPKMMRCEMSEQGIVTVEMPFHLPPVRKPKGPNVYPIMTDSKGRRKICLAFTIGLDFTSDNISVDTDGQRLSIRATRAAISDKYGEVAPGRDLKKEFNLPDYIQVDTVRHEFVDGKLTIDVFLKDEKEKCETPKEDTSSSSS